jgi:hypothetical protein
MAFTKETASKAGKKSKRGPNKQITAKRELIESKFDETGGVTELFSDIAAIKDPAQRVNAKLKLMEFFAPRLKAVDMNTTIQDEREELTAQEIEDRLIKLKEEMKQFDDD